MTASIALLPNLATTNPIESALSVTRRVNSVISQRASVTSTEVCRTETRKTNRSLAW
jgi:hypothetical protein